MGFAVYILRSQRDGRLYVGQTNDLQWRLAQHNDPNFRGTLHTKRHAGPWRLIHSEQFPTRADAMRRERQLKTGAGRRFIQGRLDTIQAGGC